MPQPKYMAQVIADLVTLQHDVLRLAVEESPNNAINYIAEHFEEAGVEDPETRDLLDAWWKRQREAKGGA